MRWKYFLSGYRLSFYFLHDVLRLEMLYFNEVQFIYVLALWASHQRWVKGHKDPHRFSSKNFIILTLTFKYLTYMWVSSYCSSIHWRDCCFLIGCCYTLLQSSWPHIYNFLFLTLFYRTSSGLFFCNCHFEEPMSVTVPLKQSLK